MTWYLREARRLWREGDPWWVALYGAWINWRSLRRLRRGIRDMHEGRWNRWL